MSMPSPQRIPRIPTQPVGVEVASYATYLEAQRAVDFLGEKGFAVQNVIIVGTDLKSIERVTGRMTYGRAAIAGAGSGAWFGLFVGVLMSMFGGGGPGGPGAHGAAVMIGIGLGAGFGLLFSVLSYTLTRRHRDFTSSSQIVAASYALLCPPAAAAQASGLLAQSPVGAGRAAVRTPATVAPAPTPSPVQAPASVQTPAPVAPAAAPTTNGDPYAVVPGVQAPVAPTPVAQAPQAGSPSPSPTAAVEATEAAASTDPPQPRKVDPRWLTEDGRPK